MRDQHLTAAGHHVIRITARQIDHRPYALIARIASVITTLRLSAGQDGSRPSADGMRGGSSPLLDDLPSLWTVTCGGAEEIGTLKRPRAGAPLRSTALA